MLLIPELRMSDDTADAGSEDVVEVQTAAESRSGL